MATTAGEEKIFVSVRLRPLNEKEISRNDVSDWECINDNTIIFRNNLPVPDRSMYPTAYTFDKVFRCDSSTRQVYEEGAKEVALSVVRGINTSIFAYGQTSSGKTYTMSGITEYTIADIYDYIDKHKEREFLLKFSAMEIYNESVRDLLIADTTPLRLLDDPEKGTTVEKLTEEIPRDLNHFKELLSICEAQRQIGETFLNETSSRSHQILRLTIESCAREFLGNDTSSILTATVNFVDLAGSERASQSLSAGTRLKEGCHINRSLLTLGTVIRKLSKGRNGHIPFRDSKLTRILQPSLGINARTAIICTMSPARIHVEQSRNTLLFASCAKEVSTNAQVNVVMSDKALVKQLQRELARLESELRGQGPNSVTSDFSALLREKDVQIEKLETENNELTLQLDQARCQIKDLLRVKVIENDRTSEAGYHDHYPKLRVRKSWDFDHSLSDASTVADPNSIDLHARTLDTPQSSDRYNESNINERYDLQNPESEEIFLPDDTSPCLSISSTPKIVGNNWDDTEEPNKENVEDTCKEVRCIEIEDSSNKYVKSNVLSLEEENRATSALTVVDNEDRGSEESVSVQLMEGSKFNLIPSPEKSSAWLLKEDMSSSRGWKLMRSSSCRASPMTSLSSSVWFENEATPNESFHERIGDLQRKISALDFDVSVETLSRKGSQTFVGGATVGENKTADVKLSNVEDVASIDSFVAGLKEMAKLQYEKQLDHGMVEETEPEPKADGTPKNVKDVGLDPIQDGSESPINWPSEFESLQREIVELWHICNASLVHRTYFFLLFKGDLTDSVYMNVELRRLTFLKEIFSRGNHTVEDGTTLTPASSVRSLRREREMLSRKMRKKLSKQDRESLYRKWGIRLDSKQRRLQLAYSLWTDSKDMGHITDSATVVAKLVGLVEPGRALKEMFGLNFTPGRTSRRSFGWKRSLVYLS